jgi:hypothetical protein
VTVAFIGSEIHLYGVVDPRSGMASVSLDGGAETKVDFYASVRAGNKLLYSSPVLAQGPHSFKVRVDGTKTPAASGLTIAVDRVDLR